MEPSQVLKSRLTFENGITEAGGLAGACDVGSLLSFFG